MNALLCFQECHIVLNHLTLHINPKGVSEKLPYIYVLDVLWGQPIKLIQVVSTSEFHEY